MNSDALKYFFTFFCFISAICSQENYFYFHVPNALRNQEKKSPKMAIDNVIHTTLLDECAMKVLSILNPVYNWNFNLKLKLEKSNSDEKIGQICRFFVEPKKKRVFVSAI